jgi:type I restriction enzyme M protein
MAIVLPEGVLNNTNLQKIRDFVESKAKIILITSIPQDVFIASGATVKPSLLFFKKFTEADTKAYKIATDNAFLTIQSKINQALQADKMEVDTLAKNTERFDAEIKRQNKSGLKVKKNQPEWDNAIKKNEADKNSLKELQKALVAKEKKMWADAEREMKMLVKQNFDYTIPIAEVEKAGISSTGTVIENELEPLAKEFIQYRKQNNIWETKFDKIEYQVLDDEKIYRIPSTGNPAIAGEPEVFYGK